MVFNDDDAKEGMPAYLSYEWAVMGMRDGRWKDMFRIYQDANKEKPPTDNG